MSFAKILTSVGEYYSEKINTHGPTARGVDWNSTESQHLRFEQLLKICDGVRGPLSINDYGCGYGALADFLIAGGYDFRYRGFDISEGMIAKARELHAGEQRCEFSVDESFLEAADYTIASGIFNVKLNMDDEEWRAYILHTLEKIARLSRKGFAFNILTIYSDKEYMRENLYYADPGFLFDHCKRNFSKYVALLHDYPLYEFTVHVKF